MKRQKNTSIHGTTPMPNPKSALPKEYPMHEIEPTMMGPDKIVYGNRLIPPPPPSYVT